MFIQQPLHVHSFRTKPTKIQQLHRDQKEQEEASGFLMQGEVQDKLSQQIYYFATMKIEKNKQATPTKKPLKRCLLCYITHERKSPKFTF